jgi:2'-5' RNA ligase
MAFLGIQIPNVESKLLSEIDVPGKKENINEFHITMIFLEDKLNIKKISSVIEAAYAVLENAKPFIVTTDTITCFPVNNNDPYPIIAKIDSKELHTLNDKIKKEFDKQNIEYSKKFKDYKPHITLSYSDEKIEDFKIDPITFTVGEIVVWCGSHNNQTIKITFPLKQNNKHSFLLQKIDLFYKFACITNSY